MHLIIEKCDKVFSNIKSYIFFSITSHLTLINYKCSHKISILRDKKNNNAAIIYNLRLVKFAGRRFLFSTAKVESLKVHFFCL